MEAPPGGTAAREAEGGVWLRDEPLLLAELKPGRPQQYDWKASCETWSVAFSPDGTWFAWSQGHCIVKLIPWPLEEAELSCKASERKNRGIKADVRGGGGAKEKTLECGQIVWGLAFSSWPPCGAKEGDGLPASGRSCLILATGLNDGQIKVWEVQTGRLLFSLSGHLDVVRDLSFAPNGSLILVSASRDKTLRIWDLSRDGTSKQIQVLSGHTQWVYCCSISPDCSMLCSAAGEKSAFLWSMRSYTLIRKLEGHQSSVVSCDFSPDSALLVTASYDTCVIMWDPYTGEQLRTLRHVPLPPALDYGSDIHASSLRSVCFSPEGLYLATVADDRLLRIWDLELRTPVAFAPMTNGLCCVYFPHGGFIATGTRDGHVQFWSAPKVLSSLKHLCRKALRTFLTTYQVLALPIPKKMKEFLTYRTF
ncbi:WD repeat and SOCS box-containing protein 2 isoform X1 [Trachemys scripta elegans]|uniref:WD repeat and SOCS box-containing protein 2 isoform X1 n=1 Tax=Trachemys scripta elegans TaxID=31138 RepID=UPI001556F763|nr:WD repeat and SOCS box-containing protein 2 isoform X1 [Trachemys scripta elegans]